MRKRFEAQLTIGGTPIEEIKITTKSRDEFPPYLRAMQYIYCNEELNEKVYSMLEDKICKGKKDTGRPGMNLWEIFVLAGTRLCLNINYDRLHDMANNHLMLRKILGVDDRFTNGKEYEYQNIVDNFKLLDDQTLKEINEIIVEAAHGLLKKKETEALRLKTDTYVMESNVHFPTDINLLWDSGRKCLETIEYIIDEGGKSIAGWRKIKNWKRELKIKMRKLSKISSRGGFHKEEMIKKSTKDYLKKANLLSQKVTDFIDHYPLESESDFVRLLSLEYFLKMLNKHIDLVYRRLIKGEKIPAQEKIFSIFETYTEWITKGKLRPNVELGKKLLITTDQYGLIVDYHVVEKQADVDLLIPLVNRLLNRYKIQSISADKGFWKKEIKELLSLFIPEVVIPKKGKLNITEKEIERSRAFKGLKNQHSEIESNINQLEHNGLDRCPDKSYYGFKRYVGVGVISYNLHIIGKYLIMLDKAKENKKSPMLKKVA